MKSRSTALNICSSLSNRIDTAVVETFNITADYIQLNQLLKASGLCATGGEANMAIENGRVRVDGAIETRKRCKTRTGQTVTFERHVIKVVQDT